MTFVGDNDKARAIDVWSQNKLYVASTHLVLASWDFQMLVTLGQTNV